MSGTAPRKQAPRLARPAARYRRGQVPKGADVLPSDSDESGDEEHVQEGEEEGDVMIGGMDADENEDEEDENTDDEDDSDDDGGGGADDI